MSFISDTSFNFNAEAAIGTILVVWGVSIFIKLIFGIDIPIFKPLLAIFLIYWGICLLLGPTRPLFTYHYSSTSHSTINEEEKNDH